MSNLELLRDRLSRSVTDPDSFFEILDPDVVWDLSDTPSPMAGVYRGRDAVRELYRRWAGAFSDWNFEIERLIEADDDVVVFVREHGHGRSSGIEVEMSRASVWTFTDGKVIRFRSFSSCADALEAAGLEPDAA